MDILILGGTQFIGRHIAETLLAAGHRVSVFNRGRSADELPAGVERLRGDRDAGRAGLDSLRGRAWDVCIDVCGYTAVHVRSSAEMLRACVGRYVYVSAVSAYGDPTDRPVFETHPLQPGAAEDVTEINGETYGALKVTCERIVSEIYGDRCTILRPQIVVGPHDQTDRYSFWLLRAARSNEMLAPGDGSDHVQVIDVRDVARFVARVIEHAIGGTFNLAGPRLTWREFVVALGGAAPVWVPAHFIAPAEGGEFQLSLYRTERGPRSGLMDVSSARACAAGLVLTSPVITARDTLEWLRSHATEPWLTLEHEAELIRRAKRR